MITLRRLTLLILVLSLTLPVASPVFADTTYLIQPGDTLTKIAARFNVTIEALRQANKLKDADTLQVGQTLVIPDGRPPAAPSDSGRPRTYIAQNGDSLSRVAAKFNVTIEALIAANNLTTTTLHPGQTLIIPGPTPALVSANSVSSVYDRISGRRASSSESKSPSTGCKPMTPKPTTA